MPHTTTRTTSAAVAATAIQFGGNTRRYKVIRLPATGEQSRSTPSALAVMATQGRKSAPLLTQAQE